MSDESKQDKDYSWKNSSGPIVPLDRQGDGFTFKGAPYVDREWPGEVELAGITEPLSEEQDARACALYHANNVLTKKGAMGTETPPGVADLLAVAEWILSGDWIDWSAE